MATQFRPADIQEAPAPRTFQPEVDRVRIRLHHQLDEMAIYADPTISCLQVQKPEVIHVVFGSRLAVRKKEENDPMAGLRYAVGLENVGRKRRALDRLYRLVDSFFRADDFDGCDRFLANADVDAMGTHLMIGLLTVTAAERERLPNRSVLATRIRSRLEQVAPDRIERLMSGLE